MDEDHLKKDNSATNDFWRDGSIKEMADREYFHLRTAEELEERIAAIQRSTHSDIQFLARAHDYLRMKFRWYYKWHTLKSSNYLHYFVLAMVMIIILTKIYLAYH